MAGKVLVAYATMFGSTGKVAETIAAALRQTGVEVDVRPVAEVDDLSGYRAVVVGSAVRVGRWVRPARTFIRRFKVDLASMPVAVFACRMGVVRGPKVLDELFGRLWALSAGGICPVAKATFAGKSDRSRLSRFWKVAMAMIRIPEGDYRDWDTIRAWGRGLAGPLGLVSEAVDHKPRVSTTA